MPTFVIGPPGTGKTHWIMDDVERTLKTGVGPESICLVTFTNAAALEMLNRIKQRFPEYSKEDFPWVGTLHSLCKRCLQVSSKSLFISHQKEFAKAFRYEYSDLPGSVREDIEIGEAMLVTDADWFEHFDNFYRNACISFEDGMRRFYDAGMRMPLGWNPQTQRLYAERKRMFMKEKGLYDFTDLLELVIRRRQRPDLRYLWCDEAQDNSPLLWRVLDLWEIGCDKAVYVGDPDQSIFGFLPADPKHFYERMARGTITTLEESHRLPRRILDLSEAWIGRNKERYERPFRPRNAEGIVDRFCSMDLMPFEQAAASDNGRWAMFVLSRTRRQSLRMKQWFIEQGLPFATNRGTENILQTGKGHLVYSLLALIDGDEVRLASLRGLVKWLPQKGWMKYGSKAAFKRAITDNGDVLLKGKSTLFDYGFTESFVQCLCERDFLTPLLFGGEEKSYVRSLYRKWGREMFTRRPNILVTNIHAVKGMECDTVVFDPTLTRMPFEAMQKASLVEEERRVAYTGMTRPREKLLFLRPSGPMYYET